MPSAVAEPGYKLLPHVRRLGLAKDACTALLPYEIAIIPPPGWMRFCGQITFSPFARSSLLASAVQNLRPVLTYHFIFPTTPREVHTVEAIYLSLLLPLADTPHPDPTADDPPSGCGSPVP